MATNFQIWGSDGWKFLVRYLGGGDLTGITVGWGYNLAAVRALNASIRAENRAARQQCWANGHFVTMAGKCVDDPEVGVEKALKQLNGDTPWNISNLRRQRLEGYVANQFYREWENAVESGEGSSIQGVIEKYGQYSDVMSTNPFIGGLSFNLMNPQNILDRAILGDEDIGVTVQICTTTVTTNCVDPKNIKDIWEDFGRHIQVIFKGLEIPGLPDWLPLPGIMRLPTIGEIWDKISGPFNDAAREQMRDCMSKDDDGDGVANTASYCYENRDIAGIINQGILDGAGEIADATTEAVKGIVDKALETLDCVTDPAACATKVKDTIEGIFGSADPTQPGLPDWMRVIIIGSQYGDEVLKELEKIFNEDIDGDGTIGITPTQEYCADGVTVKEDAEGTNCPEYAQFGYCADGTTKKQDAKGTNCAEYAPNGYCKDGTTVKSDAAGTNCEEYSEFGYCQDGTTKKQDAAGTNCSEYAEFGYCEDGTTKKEDSAGTNCSEYTPDYGMCDDGLTKKTDAEGTNCPGPEPEVDPGDPCDLEDGKTGSYQYVGDDLQCLPDPPEFGFCQDGVTEKADTDGTNCTEYAPNGYCQDGTTKKDNAEGTNCEEYSEFGYCQDGTTKKDNVEGTNCSEYVAPWENSGPSEQDCAALGKTHVPADEATQTPSSCGGCKQEGWTDTGASGECVAPTTTQVDCTKPRPGYTPSYNPADNAAHFEWIEECGATHCPDGSTKDSHVNGDCQLGLTSDCQDPQTDEQKRNCGWTECGTDTANPGVLVQSTDQCGSPVDCSEITEDNYLDCKKVKCPEGSEKPYADSLDDCVAAPAPTCEENDPNSESDGQGGCQCKQDYAMDNDQNSPTFGTCQPTKLPPKQCTNESGDPSGAENYPDCNKCPEGQDFNEKGICDDIPVVTCEDPNRQKNNDGSCGENCNSGFDQPAGYDVCTSIQQLCDDGAEGYGPDNELCGTTDGCPEGQKKFDGTNCDKPCPDNADIGASDKACGLVVNCDEPKIGYTPSFDYSYKAKWDAYSAEYDETCGTGGGVVTCQDPNATNYEQQGECGPCKDLYDKPEGYDECTLIETLCQEDPNYAEGNELCEGPCDDGEVEFVDQNGEVFCDSPCAYNDQIASSSPDCVAPPPPETCNDPNAVNDGEEGSCECKPGFSKDPETLLCVQGTTVCDNGATVESGCDTCPDGTSVLEYEDGMCPSKDICENGATDYPDCTVCPEGQSMDAEGNCTNCSDCSCAEYAAANPEECITQPPPPPPETGGGGMLGGGSFTPFLAGISYTPQAVPEPPAPPQKDYMAELDNLIKRSLFEGMA